MMDSFLPGAYNLIQLIKNNGSANVELGLYSKIAGLLVNLKLDGLGQFFDLIIWI